MSTAVTPSRLSQSANSTIPAPNHGGIFEAALDEPRIDEPHVAIYAGPASSLAHYQQLLAIGPELVPVSEFHQWSKTAAFPQVPSHDAFQVWRKMKMHPRFDGSDLDRKADVERTHRIYRQHPTPDASNPDRITDNERAASTASTTVNSPPPPRGWKFRPIQGDYNATTDRHRFLRDDGRGASEQWQNSTQPTTDNTS